MSKMVLEFDLEEELEDAERAIVASRIFYYLDDFEQAMRSANRYQCGPIWEEYLKEKKAYPDESDAQNMLDAVRKVYYEITMPIREFIE